MLEKLLAYLNGAHQKIDTIDDALWQRVIAAVPLLRRLHGEEQALLKQFSERFLAEKRFFGGDGLEPDLEMAIRIAALTCLPVLHLGYDWLEEVHELVIYPDVFLVHHRERDEIGVVHEHYGPLSGQAWSHGTLVLSWPDVLGSGMMSLGHNVVIHEIAHVLDARNGAFNGFPPLPHSMDPKRWTDDLSAAFNDLNHALDAGLLTPIDPYAATSPTEFFAVCSEYHFERPDILQAAYPAVAAQLQRFYRHGQ